MNAFSAALLLALVLCASAFANADGDYPVASNLPRNDYYGLTGECTPGEQFIDVCNTCICGGDGKAASCTMKACYPDGILRIDNYFDGKSCPAGKTFYDRCNACLCGNDGKSAACTYVACPESGVQKSLTNQVVDDNVPVVHGYKPGQKCPAKHFYADCNACVCSDDGVTAACTLEACVETRPRRSVASYPRNDFFSETGECAPGRTFMDKCNTCKCSNDGKTAACTDMACPETTELHIDGYTLGQKCPAGKTFYDVCNACLCGNNGNSAACTYMACPESGVQRSLFKQVVDDSAPVVHGYKPGQKCPAKHFYADCNACVCSDDGVTAACTLKACVETRPRRSVASYPRNDFFSEVGECAPGRTFMDQCNTCHCSNDGKTAACTLMACPGTEQLRIDGYTQGQKCPAGKTFYDVCNACLCGNDGQSAACTFMACSESGVHKSLFKQIVDENVPVVHGYKPGQKCPAKHFYADCNACVCSDDGVTAACTLKLCPKQRTRRSVATPFPRNDFFSETGECAPGRTFMDRCNTCWCSNDGKSAGCTLMACAEPEQLRIDGYTQGQKCPAGKAFYDDCNSCICGADGQSAACTYKFCPAQPRTRRSAESLPHIDNFHQIQECTPGKAFIDKCNSCICSTDGKTAACTDMACPDFDEAKPRIDGYVHGNKCPAGKTFYNVCNSCQCSASGRSAFCTLMACPDFE